MLEEVKRIGREPEIRIFHHRTRAMKFRKLLYSMADPSTARDVVRKIAGRVRGAFRRG
jgi:hypothetical protein